MARPTSSAMRLRTMRTRSSPRCSMKGILSVTLAMPDLPALHEVAQGADAAARLEARRDRGGHVALGLLDGIGQRPAAREPGGDGGRERAARAVGMRRIETGRREAAEDAAVPQ